MFLVCHALSSMWSHLHLRLNPLFTPRGYQLSLQMLPIRCTISNSPNLPHQIYARRSWSHYQSLRVARIAINNSRARRARDKYLVISYSDTLARLDSLRRTSSGIYNIDRTDKTECGDAYNLCVLNAPPTTSLVIQGMRDDKLKTKKKAKSDNY